MPVTRLLRDGANHRLPVRAQIRLALRETTERILVRVSSPGRFADLAPTGLADGHQATAIQRRTMAFAAPVIRFLMRQGVR